MAKTWTLTIDGIGDLVGVHDPQLVLDARVEADVEMLVEKDTNRLRSPRTLVELDGQGGGEAAGLPDTSDAEWGPGGHRFRLIIGFKAAAGARRQEWASEPFALTKDSTFAEVDTRVPIEVDEDLEVNVLAAAAEAAESAEQSEAARQSAVAARAAAVESAASADEDRLAAEAAAAAAITAAALMRDSGWRNLAAYVNTAVLSTGTLYWRRIGNRVIISLDNGTFAAASGVIASGLPAPADPWGKRNTVAIATRPNIAVAGIVATNGPGNLFLNAGVLTNSLQARAEWIDDSPWPTVLPGTPV